MTSIDLTDPENPVWGSPAADPAKNPHSVGKPTAAAITVELGSLYDGVANAPVQAGGNLFDLTVDEDCDVSIAVNEDIGGIVLEGTPPTQASLDPDSGGTITGDGPECWTYAQFCCGDSDNSGLVDTDDWPFFRDSFYKNYAEHWNGGAGPYDPCGDYNMDGIVDTDDWPFFRDNFYKYPACTCSPGTWPPS
jgi:hypothetical protein